MANINLSTLVYALGCDVDIMPKFKDDIRANTPLGMMALRKDESGDEYVNSKKALAYLDKWTEAVTDIHLAPRFAEITVSVSARAWVMATTLAKLDAYIRYCEVGMCNGIPASDLREKQILVFDEDVAERFYSYVGPEVAMTVEPTITFNGMAWKLTFKYNPRFSK